MSPVRQAFFSVLLIVVSLAFGLAVVEAYLWYRAGYQPVSSDQSSTLFKFEDLYVSSKPLAVFDRISGYRRAAGPTRIVRIMRDELIYDQTFTPNNKGYISAIDFTERKADPRAVRLIVFGDSFTASEFLPTPWPDRVNRALQGKTTRPIELYSFAVNGAGAWNWNSIFFNEVVPRYEFDAVLLAVWGDDIARGYTVLHYDEAGQSWLSRLDVQPASDQEFFADYFPKFPKHYAKVATNDQIDAMVAAVSAPWHRSDIKLRTPGLIAEQWARFKRRNAGLARLTQEAQTTAAAGEVPLEEIAAKYGAVQFAKFAEIMDYCRANRIPVILASIPSHDAAVAVAKAAGREETGFQREIRSLAGHFGALYVDGHAPFAVVPPADINRRYWLKYDGHWNQAGSDLFAETMSRYLIDHQNQLLRGDGQKESGVR